ncbi:MAG: ATP-binding cassette domain-containing protein [Hungatella sp.]|jgi:NitT/TauT family transport system ATP-binding protein|nr:ATP-binding cassette domain-containing protein [Hungatella sp.]
MLNVKDISVTYGKGGTHRAIDQMSWQLETGTVLAVAGPSGCGKSTMVHALAGILPYTGSITLDGTGLDPKSCSIGLIPQNYGLLPWKTVKENCLFTAKIRGNTSNLEVHLTSLCKELGIDGLLDRYPGTLSGGQAQRVALARAFLMNPELLLMDEPFAALDIAAALTARELFLRVWKEKKPTTVIVTHRVEDALYLAHRIAVMKRGGSFDFFSENPWQGVKRPSEPAYRLLEQQITENIIKADEI